MNSKEIIKYLKNSIDEKGNYCYSLPIETTKKTIKCIKEKDKEIERLNNIINELEKWLNEKICLNKNDKYYINGMTFVGVNLQMYQMFLDKLQELKGDDKK